MLSQLTWLLFANVLLPSALGWAAAAFPPFAFILGLPVVGPYIKDKIEAVCKKLFDQGVITVKWEVLDAVADHAKKGYEPQIALLKEAQTREFLSEEEEQEYEKRLKDGISNHPGIVHS